MTKTISIKEPYFSHDISTRESKEIKKIINDFGYEGYGLWWAIVEYMHRNELEVGEEFLIINDSRYNDKIKSILNNYNLFRIEDDFYISDRILRNIEEQENKANKNRDAANSRWLLADYAKEYEKVFGIRPEIDDKEIKKLKQLNAKIPDLKKKLPAIFTKLATIKFDVTSGFVPRSDWLLKDNNLQQILNGQYGELKTDSAQVAEIKAAKNRYLKKIEDFDISKIDTKEDAIDFIVRDNIDHRVEECHEQLMEHFGISLSELTEYAKEIENA